MHFLMCFLLILHPGLMCREEIYQPILEQLPMFCSTVPMKLSMVWLHAMDVKFYIMVLVKIINSSLPLVKNFFTQFILQELLFKVSTQASIIL